MLAAALLLLALAPAVQTDEPATERPSLEQVLALARQRAAAERERLRPMVASLLAQLTALGPDGPDARRAEVRAALRELGPAAAPLLATQIDPGPEPDETAQARAAEAVRALEHVATPAVTDALIATARDGTPLGRRNAIHVLGFSAEPQRAGAALVAIYRGREAQLARDALSALARLRDPAHTQVFGEALSSSDPALVNSALLALTTGRGTEQAAAVARLLANQDRGLLHADAVLAYHLACPEVVTENDLAAWLTLVESSRLKASQGVRILEAFPAFAAVKSSAIQKRLEVLETSPYPTLREASLLCRALVGDRGARRDLLRSYDEAVDEFPALYEPYKLRAEVQFKLADYEKAVRDYKRALQQDIEQRERKDELRIELARCYVRQDKLKAAADVLEETWLTAESRSALRLDPDFSILAAHAKYGAFLRAD